MRVKECLIRAFVIYKDIIEIIKSIFWKPGWCIISGKPCIGTINIYILGIIPNKCYWNLVCRCIETALGELTQNSDISSSPNWLFIFSWTNLTLVLSIILKSHPSDDQVMFSDGWVTVVMIPWIPWNGSFKAFEVETKRVKKRQICLTFRLFWEYCCFLMKRILK